ncbi:MAG: hypothetical protein L3K10_04785, partial [Thermoplasmata archaeon]|nr:hypothetical protein [Thermoplasmata archaeon]
LTVQFPLEGGSDAPRVAVRADWGAPPGGCTLVPSWFDWFLPRSPVPMGSFEDPADSLTDFVPAIEAPAIAEVGVRSAAAWDCGRSNASLVRVAYGNVSVFPPVHLTNLTADPSESTVPAFVQLSGDLTGGRPPYFVGVAWGDGSFNNSSRTSDGPIRLTHTYSEGTYEPELGVIDANRAVAHATVPEPIDVTNGMALAIDASRPLAEVGWPLQFSGIVARPWVHFGVGMGCTPEFSVPPQTFRYNVTCRPTVAGLLPVSLEVAAPVPSQDVETTRWEPVAPAVTLGVRPVASAVDQGVSTLVRATVLGGIPPFRVTCVSVDGTLQAVVDLAEDGSVLLPWTPTRAGSMALGGTVRDALGAVGSAGWTGLEVSPTPGLALQTHTTFGANLTSVLVQGTLSGGASGTRWALASDPGPAEGAEPVGTSSNRTFDWSGSFTSEGVAGLAVEVVDAAGTLLLGNVTFDLPVPPRVTCVALPSAISSSYAAALLVDVTGGIPPYTIWINGSGVALWNGSEATSGPALLTVPVGHPGSTALSLALRDQRGTLIVTNVTVVLATYTPPRIAPPVVEWAPWLAVVGTAALGIGLVAFRHRLRPVRAEPIPPDPELILEQLLAPADGADRLTIELMAEEAGVPLETAHRTIDRLVAQGRVRAETDPDGGEVLAWSSELDR